MTPAPRAGGGHAGAGGQFFAVPATGRDGMTLPGSVETAYSPSLAAHGSPPEEAESV